MPSNFLVTGPPGVGKTTVVQKVISSVEDRGFEAGGLFCPEIRDNGRRMGFKIKDLSTGKSRILAHVNNSSGPKVSRYGVDVDNVDFMSELAISRALDSSDLIVIDEVAPMEIYSEEFRTQTWKALESEKPLLAVVHRKSKSGFIGDVKDREDAEIFSISKENRNRLPKELTESVIDNLE